MSNGKFVFTIRELIYLIVAILMFFQIYLQTYIGFFQYLDEIVTVVFLVLIITEALKRKLEKVHGKMLLLMCAVAVLGLISNVSAKVQTGLVPILTDVGNTFKVFVVYIGSSIYLKKVRRKDRITRRIAFVIRLFVLVCFFFMILHETGVYVMGNDVRYGLVSFRFINANAGLLSYMFYSVILTLTLKKGLSNPNLKRNVVIILMALAIWVSTLRVRAVAFVIIYILLYWLIIVKEQRIKFNFRTILAIISVIFLICLDQVDLYFTSTTTARANLLRYGFYTMLRYFPLGSGFATFGTDAAAKYYSDLYVEYGFDSIWGLSSDDARFASDSYWPAIFAQFGIVGTVLMCILVLSMCKDILKRAKRNKYSCLAALFLVITQLTASVATATFFHYITVGLFLLVPLLFDSQQDKSEIEGRQYETTNRIYSHI